MIQRSSSRRGRKPGHTALARKNKRRGTAAVEFALVAPIFMLFLFGTIELGRLALARNVLANASREAARFAVIQGATESGIIAIAEQYASAGSVEGIATEVDETDSMVTVEVSISFADVSWLPGTWFLRDQVLSATTTMRKESIEISTVEGSGT